MISCKLNVKRKGLKGGPTEGGQKGVKMGLKEKGLKKKGVMREELKNDLKKGST